MIREHILDLLYVTVYFLPLSLHFLAAHKKLVRYIKRINHYFFFTKINVYSKNVQ
jgi:hypothetical protein